MVGVQGTRAYVVDGATGQPHATLEKHIEPQAKRIADFADRGTMRLMWELGELWPSAFLWCGLRKRRMVWGVILLDSNAQTHFSFTNALGLVTTEQIEALERLLAHFPHAKWIVALHHHVIEYPMPAKALSERIGTALVNGTWFVRRMQRWADRAIIMHGHRHIDWIGHCGGSRHRICPIARHGRDG